MALGILGQKLGMTQIFDEKDQAEIFNIYLQNGVFTPDEVRRIVVGLPLDMDGGRGTRARVTEVFIERLKGATGLPVIPWDERLTTVQAERILISGDVRRARRREVIDQVAAVIVLQAYLDSQRREGDAAGVGVEEE